MEDITQVWTLYSFKYSLFFERTSVYATETYSEMYIYPMMHKATKWKYQGSRNSASVLLYVLKCFPFCLKMNELLPDYFNCT